MAPSKRTTGISSRLRTPSPIPNKTDKKKKTWNKFFLRIGSNYRGRTTRMVMMAKSNNGGTGQRKGKDKKNKLFDVSDKGSKGQRMYTAT